MHSGTNAFTTSLFEWLVKGDSPRHSNEPSLPIATPKTQQRHHSFRPQGLGVNVLCSFPTEAGIFNIYYLSWTSCLVFFFVWVGF